MKKAELLQAVHHLEKCEWQAAHKIVQEDEQAPLACWAHGIVHLVEGDLPNARYWYGQAGRKLPREPVVAQEIEALRKAV